MIQIKMGSEALNEAGWRLLEEIQNVTQEQVSPVLFNNLKGCLKVAIEVYLNEALKKEIIEQE